jgi:hypothetical protein
MSTIRFCDNVMKGKVEGEKRGKDKSGQRLGW